MIITSPTQLIEATPLLKVTGFGIPEEVNLYVKLEMLHPAGGIKDRVAKHMIESYVNQGLIDQRYIIIDASAGNTALSIAFVAKSFGINTIFFIPDKFSKEKRILLRAMGAEVIETPGDQGMIYAMKRAEALRKQVKYGISLNQFENSLNPQTHMMSTVQEILTDLQHMDMFVCGAGSSGTFTGIATGLKKKLPNLKTVLVDPVGSQLGGVDPNPISAIEGIGNAFIPPIFNQSLVDEMIKIHLDDALRMTQQIAYQLGLFVGVSSGANLFAAIKKAQQLQQGTILTVFFDRGDRYFSQKIYERKVYE